ncbi:MAG: ABC transporter permease [Planctomycetes bacterium]|nr:ABC transporter permease [Planctomycetota bacterium]
MRLVPLRYTVRSLVVRWSPSLFSALGIGLTVAVLGGVLALREGFRSLLAETGSDDVVVYLRPGAQSEGESIVRHPQDTNVLKARPEVVVEGNVPLAAAESYLGLKLPRTDGSGTTIVTVRGVEIPVSMRIQGPKWRLVEGKEPRPGSDEVVVGRPLTTRIVGCKVGETLTFNVTPFKVVGVFVHDGAYASEIWGDVDRICAALERPFRQRLVAKVKEGTDVAALEKQLESDKQVPVKAQTERAYFRAQTTALGNVLQFLAGILTTLMGAAAVLGAVNTMLAAVGARTREVGILMSIGYRRFPVFFCFLVEAAAIGLVGGVLGAVLVLPFNGLQTSTTNWNTFTEIAFAFRVTPTILATSVVVAVVLGLLGGAVPAWRASRLVPTAALRRL